MSRSSFYAAAAFLLAASGCASSTSGTAPRTDPLALSREVTLTAAGQKSAHLAATPVSFKFPDERSYSAVPPAFQPKECDLTSTNFTARIKIPSKVYLPAYGPGTPPMNVHCKSQHYEFDEDIEVVNLTQAALNATAAAHILFGYGLVGAAVTAGQASSRDKSKDLYGYPLTVKLQ